MRLDPTRMHLVSNSIFSVQRFAVPYTASRRKTTCPTTPPRRDPESNNTTGRQEAKRIGAEDQFFFSDGDAHPRKTTGAKRFDYDFRVDSKIEKEPRRRRTLLSQTRSRDDPLGIYGPRFESSQPLSNPRNRIDAKRNKKKKETYQNTIRMVLSSTLTGSSVVYEARPARAVHLKTYNWPTYQINIWLFVMLLAASSILGVFATFIQTQTQMGLPVPWYFPYYVTVAAVALAFLLAVMWLIWYKRLLPAIVMLGAFALFVLWMVGLVASAVQLWGPGGVQSVCNMQVFNQSPHAPDVQTLAWMQQRNICKFSSIGGGEKVGDWATLIFYYRSNVVFGLCNGLDGCHLFDLGHDYSVPSICSFIVCLLRVCSSIIPVCLESML